MFTLQDLQSTIDLLQPFEYYIFGGWALEPFSSKPREHEDLDVCLKQDQFTSLRRVFENEGFETYKKSNIFEFQKNNTHIGLLLIHEDDSCYITHGNRRREITKKDAFTNTARINGIQFPIMPFEWLQSYRGDHFDPKKREWNDAAIDNFPTSNPQNILNSVKIPDYKRQRVLLERLS